MVDPYEHDIFHGEHHCSINQVSCTEIAHSSCQHGMDQSSPSIRVFFQEAFLIQRLIFGRKNKSQPLIPPGL